MNKSNPFVDQIRQPPSIGGRQVCDSSLIKIGQGSGSPGGINKQTHGRIYTYMTDTQFPISSPRKSYTLIKGFNSRMANRFQTNPAKDQWKVWRKSAMKISNGLRTRLVLISGKMRGPTLWQMLSITLLQQVLQNSTINRGGDYMIGACLTLITPQDIQLNIQMPQEHKGQW